MKYLINAAFTAAFLLMPLPAKSQEMFSPFVPSAAENVERMLKLAKLRDGDTVIDLGSGDGRVVLGAARLNATVRGIGVDLDARLVRESNAAAEQEGLASRVRFLQRNVFDADLSKVDVIFMWLFPELQRLLRSKILAEARPGTRVVTNLWDMGSWPADDVDDDSRTKVHFWVVPAKVEGRWSWSTSLEGRSHAYAAVLEQRFQNGEGVVRLGSRRRLLHDVKVKGDELAFSLLMTVDGVGYVRHEFAGKVRGNRVDGTVKLLKPKKDDPEEYETVTLPWRAIRAAKSAYFAKTGIPPNP
jgi:precorrin-6B methylase 2